MNTAIRTYKPNSVTVAHIDVGNRSQAELWQWWHWSGQTKFNVGSMADQMQLQRAIRDKTATLTASKRQGYIVITATRRER